LTAAGQCTCATQCPDAAHCICLFIHDEGRCIVECSGGGGTEVEIGGATIEPASLDSQVQIDVRGVDLAKLGKFLGRQSDVRGLMIPALEAGRKVDLREEYTTLRDVIERTGLVISEPRPA
jgi:hypothetical protein